MPIYVMTKQHESGIQEYLGIRRSRNLAEEELRKTYPDLNRTGRYDNSYKSDYSDNAETLFIRGVVV